MNQCTTPQQALAFVQKHGVVLVSAKGPAPRLTEAIAGEPIKGSWWGHAQGRRIFAILSAVTQADQVLVCRLLDGKLTLVHRRLWPARWARRRRAPRSEPGSRVDASRRWADCRSAMADASRHCGCARISSSTRRLSAQRGSSQQALKVLTISPARVMVICQGRRSSTTWT